MNSRFVSIAKHAPGVTNIVILIVALTLAVSLSAQVPGPGGVAARFGQSRVGLFQQPAHAVNAESPAPPSGSSFSFGLVDFPRSPDSTAFGVNSKNEIVGVYGSNLPQWEGLTQSYLLKGNDYLKLAYPGAPYTSAFGINKQGEIVGWYYDPSGNGLWHAFLLRGKNYSTIDYPGAQYTAALNINDHGEIIGLYWSGAGMQHGFMLAKGVYTTFDPPASFDTVPFGINSSGTVVGNYSEASNNSHGFIYQNGQFTTVDYPGSPNTVLTGINDKGQIIGGYGDNVTVGALTWPNPKVFLLDSGTYTTFAPPVGDAQVTWAYTLNGNDFVGFYIDSLGNIYGYEATIGQ
jgi:probable HAF family extracellular repeat protein